MLVIPVCQVYPLATRSFHSLLEEGVLPSDLDNTPTRMFIALIEQYYLYG